MSQNFLKAPRATVLAAFPDAKCKMDWTRGRMVIYLGKEANDFNKRTVIDHVVSSGRNPADAWFEAACELRLV